MERYDRLFELYEEVDTGTLRAYQDLVDLFPPVDSRVALEAWERAHDELEARKDEVRESFAAGETLADVAAHASRDQTFSALDLLSTYGRPVNALVLDVDETLRSAGRTDNEIPRETLHLLTEFVESGVPLVISTGQTLENVKGFAIQGLGNELVHSGDVAIVYEAGTGVFAPGHGARTKQLLYDDLDEDVRRVFDRVRSRVLSDAPEDLRRACHLQGNEFNVTLKPNFETGSTDAAAIIDEALCWLLDLLGEAVADAVDVDGGTGGTDDAVDVGTAGDDDAGDDAGDDAADDGAGGTDDTADAGAGRKWARAFYADADPEIRGVLEQTGGLPDVDLEDLPPGLGATFERVDVAYYHADAAEIGSRELDKPGGVEAALDVLGVADPFVLVMGDSKSDLRVMEWAREGDRGVSAAPEHASVEVLDHVVATDELVFEPGRADTVLRTAYALNRLAALE